MGSPIRLAAIAGLFSLASSVAFAQTAAPATTPGTTPTRGEEKPATRPSRSPDDWQFRFTPHAWLTNISGSATARGQTVDLNASVIDLIQKSDSLAALDAYFEANKGRFGFYGDLVWAKLQFPHSTVGYRNPIGGLQVSLKTDSALTSSLMIIEAGGIYEVAKWPGRDSSFTALDVLAGIRYWNTSADLSLDITGAVDFSRIRLERFDRSRSIAVADSGTLQWVDPLIGLRLRHQFTPSQDIVVQADIGGFGIPGSSLFSWQAVGAYSYSWQFDGYALAAIIGYRALATRITFSPGSLDSAGLDLVLHGPLLGMSVRF